MPACRTLHRATHRPPLATGLAACPAARRPQAQGAMP